MYKLFTLRYLKAVTNKIIIIFGITVKTVAKDTGSNYTIYYYLSSF